MRSYLIGALLGVALLLGCGPANQESKQKYPVLDTRTDGFDTAKAKALAEDAIVRYPDLACMVGLFAYNPPMCLDAVKEAGKLDQIRVVAFDADDRTLDGIENGEIYGTIVQNPYRYGYESVRILAALARGDRSLLPEDDFLSIDGRAITQENIKEYRDKLDRLMEGADEPRPEPSPDKPTVAYVTNGIASFWLKAEKGARDAAKEFDVNLEVRMPPKGAGDQKRMVQDLLTRGVDGIAISPIDPKNQSDLLDEIAEKTVLITHDSDAPESDRLCYVGMDNYKAGRMCGKLVKEALPEGGKVMIFVGRLEQANAKLRQQGVIDELTDTAPEGPAKSAKQADQAAGTAEPADGKAGSE